MFDDKFLARFWEKVDKTGECWNWLAYKDKDGYGQIGLNGKMRRTHRVSWIIANGRNPELLILHKCHNPSCINPNHLYEGSHALNMTDMVNAGRSGKGARNAQAKLTESQVRQIRIMPGTQQALAKIFGVSHTAIRRIKNDIRWKHLK